MELLLLSRPRLELWSSRRYSPGTEQGPRPFDRRDEYSRIVAEEPAGPPLPDGVFRHLAGAILRYEVFPPWLICGVLARTPVELGDTVGIEYQLTLGARLFFAARVVERFDEERDGVWRCGFTYRTLEGHPELGEETFSVEKELSSGKITVALRSWSRPGILLTQLGAPLVRMVQRRANEAALDHLESIAARVARNP